MRPRSRILFAALLALSWSSLASADGNQPGQADAPTYLELDVAFEQAANEVGRDSLLELPGPTSMDCQQPLTTNDLETCVVTIAASPHIGMPAAIAHY